MIKTDFSVYAVMLAVLGKAERDAVAEELRLDARWSEFYDDEYHGDV